MLKIGLIAGILSLVGGIGTAYALGFIFNESPTLLPDEKSLYEFTMKDIDGKDVKMDSYKGKVVMIVNTASKCGNTPQYEGLQALYDKYKDQGFIVLGFPANNFMGQEPGTEKEIKEFCTLKYKVTFPMFAKVSVKGADQTPLYTFLTNQEADLGVGKGDISWNFEKFLTDKNGEVIARFSPKTKPDDAKIIEAIEAALKSNKADVKK